MIGTGCPLLPVQASKPVRAACSTVFHQQVCHFPSCGAVFYLCRHCDRGRRYCTSRCREKALPLIVAEVDLGDGGDSTVKPRPFHKGILPGEAGTKKNGEVPWMEKAHLGL